MSSHHVESSGQTTGYSPTRLHTNDMEIGVTDAVQQHISRHVVAPKPISQRKLDFEHARPRWLREMAAEATGVFFYVYPGIASQASFFLNDVEPAFGSIFQIGWAYALGIAFAIITCGATSGGHFNPAVTISLAVWQGFPWKKVPYYIFAQIFGSFMAGLVLMCVYWPELQGFKELVLLSGGTLNSATGPGAILCAFPKTTQTNLGYVFASEFFVDTFLGLIIWAVLDPANPFISAAGAPFTIGLAYAVMVWGFGANTLSTNLARDLGTRIVAAIFYGGDAFTRYAPIAILTNIPATLLATAYYELVMRDSMQKIAGGHGVHEDGEDGIVRHLTRTGTINEGVAAGMTRKQNESPYSNGDSYANGNRKGHSPV